MSDDYDFSECDKLFEQEFKEYLKSNVGILQSDGFRACYRLLRPENVDYAFKELEQRLRKNAAALDSVFPQTDTATLDDEAADAIRQQAEKIAELKNEIFNEKSHVKQLEHGFDKLQAQLSRWESQPIIAWESASLCTSGVRPIALIGRLPDDEGEKDVA